MTAPTSPLTWTPLPSQPVTEITEAQAVNVALEILLHNRPIEAGEVLELTAHLDRQRYLHYVRRVLERQLSSAGPEEPKRRKLAQKLALATYKDPSLPTGERLERAWKILCQFDPPEASIDQETLGLAGAIHKYRWMLSGEKSQLERSLIFYKRGYDLGLENDLGYTGINAAFILDLLADIEARAADQTGASQGSDHLKRVEERRTAARAIREHLLKALAKEDCHEWWFVVTLAQAHFGLGHYEEAGELLEKAREKEPPDWKLESTARQFAWLARLQQAEKESSSVEPGASRAIAALWRQEKIATTGEAPAGLDSKQIALNSLLNGKLGLALSGGGFRASLFHIGVLARLAELDQLRHVEVLSCVSGGSIIGAYYYLALRELLQAKPDYLIQRQDYIDIVASIERDFLQGVQQNLRTQIATDDGRNEDQLSKADYSRSTRLAELYDQYFFSKFAGKEGERVAMRDLKIVPKGWPSEKMFLPRSENWKRAAKVPELVLNATTVNTGHNWQFTASWMGEPAAPVDRRIETNERLRRLYYDEAPTREIQNFPLSQAVAASSCVPGLFEPLVLRGLYEPIGKNEGIDGAGERVVRLVDGGVHDNQGLSSLLEQECDTLLVSDASGETPAHRDPSSELWGIYPRMTDLLMARVRSAQYADLDQRKRGGQLRDLMFLHMKRGLDAKAVNWKGCADPLNSAANSPGRAGDVPTTSYGIARDVQARLAAIRTDLDAFSDLEALALMMSGYCMTEEAAAELGAMKSAAANARHPWRFLAMKEAVGGVESNERARLLAALSVSSKIMGKWNALNKQKDLSLAELLAPNLKLAVITGAIVISLALAVYFFVFGWQWQWPVAILLLIALLAVGRVASELQLLTKTIKNRGEGKTITEVLLGRGLRCGAGLARSYMASDNDKFLAHGRIPDPRKAAQTL